MNAGDLLASLQAAGLPVHGVSIGDPNDPQTWRFDGPLSPAQQDQARVIVQGAQARSVSTAQFWPAPATALERDVHAIKQQLGLR